MPAPNQATAREPLAHAVFSIAALAAVYAVLLTRFDMRLLFSDTILTGGDSASWYQVLATLKNDFLPRGRVFGFSQANFFGYLEGQHYFPLPFLAAALAGTIAPLTVALKLATVAGGFALPLTMYAAASSMSGKKIIGSLASAASLLFLFNESYTIFGGNWLSTFAGEFCYSWAIALAPLLVASIVRDGREGRKGVLSGVLLGLTGLCHFFVFMPAFLLPIFPAFRLAWRLLGKTGLKKNKARGSSGNPRWGAEAQADAAVVYRMMTTYAIAFLVMAFWIVPMAATRKWAQPISMLWHFSSWKDFASQTLAWIWAPVWVLFIALAIIANRRKGQPNVAAFFAYGLAACGFLFFAAPGLGMPDIRFVPSALLLCILGVCVLSEPLLRIFPMPIAAVLIIIAGSGSSFMSRNAPLWFRWNYSGYEAKSEWPALKWLENEYKGSSRLGRFLWEKQDQRDNKDFGSERAFENLHLFTGYPSSEGIHYGSSFMARAATYLQSSYSPNPVDPEAERIYSVIDPGSWSARFSLLNARYIVTHSETIKPLFARHGDFELDSRYGKFEVYRFKRHRESYVQPLGDSSISIVESGRGGFRTDYYRFFRDYELYPFPFISSQFADAEIRGLAKKAAGIWGNYDDYRNVMLPRAAILGDGLEAGVAVSNESVNNFSIRFDTSQPGRPHVVSVSYAPGWRASTGEKVYPISPGFMLVIPRSGHVELVYGRSAWELAGLILSLLAVPMAILLARIQPGRKFPWRTLLVTALGIFALVSVYLVLQTEAGYPSLAKDVGAARRLDLSVKASREKALSLVEAWATADTLDVYDNMLAFDAVRIKAYARIAEGKPGEAAALLELLKRRYAHTRAIGSLPTLK